MVEDSGKEGDRALVTSSAVCRSNKVCTGFSHHAGKLTSMATRATCCYAGVIHDRSQEANRAQVAGLACGSS